MNKPLLIKNCGTLPEGTAVVCLDAVDSTSSYVKPLAAQGRRVIVTADAQTGGRGRAEHSFSSERGGVYLSLSFFPERPLEECLHYTSLAALAVRDAVFELTGLECAIKPPNDLLLDGKKLCGILTEAQLVDGRPFIVFGIGVNVTNPLPPDVPHAGRLADFAPPPAPEALAGSIVRRLLDILSRAHTQKPELMSRYESLATVSGYRATPTA